MTTCPSCAHELELDAVFCGQCGARVRARRKTLVGAELDGRFRVDAKIAEGGFGTIYRATHLGSRHVVALKVLHSDLAADENLAARFRREGATLASLNSPHTVSTYELGETDDGTLYIAMELLRGESLLDRFRARGPLPWRSVLEIMKAVCRSLGEAHALGIVHRDLKPGNIHLEMNDHVKVIDFGIAKIMSGSDIDDGNDLTRVGQAVGTLEYMAPEQLIGSLCDGRSDIYSLGVVVYEMLTGRRPYQDATGPTSLVAAVMMQPLVAPSALYACACIPPEADTLVLRALAKEPKDRFQNVAEVIDAIDKVLAPLARGSWSTELGDDERTLIDIAPLPQVADVIAIITPSSQPVHRAERGAFGPTHVQLAVSPTTSPGVTPARMAAVSPVTPSRAPTDVSSPVTPSRARGTEPATSRSENLGAITPSRAALARGSVSPWGLRSIPSSIPSIPARRLDAIAPTVKSDRPSQPIVPHADGRASSPSAIKSPASAVSSERVSASLVGRASPGAVEGRASSASIEGRASSPGAVEGRSSSPRTRAKRESDARRELEEMREAAARDAAARESAAESQRELEEADTNLVAEGDDGETNVLIQEEPRTGPRARRITPARYNSAALAPSQPFHEPTPPFAVADGSRVRPSLPGLPAPRAKPPTPPPTGSLPLVDLTSHADAIGPTLPHPKIGAFVRIDTGAERAARALEAKKPTTARTNTVKPLTVGRVLAWTILLLASGAGLGMLVGALIT